MWAYIVHQYYTFSYWPHTFLRLPPIPTNHCELLSIYPNIARVKCQVILGILNSDRLMYLILRWCWIIFDYWNNWILGVSWRLRTWSQYVHAITDFRKFGDGCGIIWLIDAMIDMIWTEDNDQICFPDRKWLIRGQEVRSPR